METDWELLLSLPFVAEDCNCEESVECWLPPNCCCLADFLVALVSLSTAAVPAVVDAVHSEVVAMETVRSSVAQALVVPDHRFRTYFAPPAADGAVEPIESGTEPAVSDSPCCLAVVGYPEVQGE